MFDLPWKVKFERRPRPLPPEYYELAENLGALAGQVAEIAKMAEATQRKVYRDIAKDDGETREEIAITRETTPSTWETGEPVN